MQTYLCPRCDHDPFLMQSTLIEHLKTRHRLEPDEINELSGVPLDPAPAEFVCDQCGRTFPKQQGLSMHKTRSHRAGPAPEVVVRDVIEAQDDMERSIVELTIPIDAQLHEHLDCRAWASGYADLSEYLAEYIAQHEIDPAITKIVKLRAQYLEVTA